MNDTPRPPLPVSYDPIVPSQHGVFLAPSLLPLQFPSLEHLDARVAAACTQMSAVEGLSDATIGAEFGIGAADSHGVLRGVAIIGRPVARHHDHGGTLEVTRVATDGAANACSALYGAARRVVRALGYRALLTYALAGGSWSRVPLPRAAAPRPGAKRRCAMELGNSSQIVTT